MEEDHKIAYGLILVSIGIAYFLFRYGKKPENLKGILRALLAFMAIYILGSIFGTHMCKAGQPYKIITIYAFLAFFWILLIDRKKMSIGGFMLIAGLTVYHSLSFSAIVHTSGYTGNPSQETRIESMRKRQLEEVKESLLVEYPSFNADITEGWASSIQDEEIREIILSLEEIEWKDVEPYSTWHTSFTGLYRTKEYPLKVWISSGTWAQAVESMKWKRTITSQEIQ